MHKSEHPGKRGERRKFNQGVANKWHQSNSTRHWRRP